MAHGSWTPQSVRAVIVVCATFTSACSPSILGPSCRDEQGAVLNVAGSLTVRDTVAYTVVSPKSSNLIMRLTWDQLDATLGLRATIIDCGGHTGCLKTTIAPPFRTGWPFATTHASGSQWSTTSAVNREIAKRLRASASSFVIDSCGV